MLSEFIYSMFFIVMLFSFIFKLQTSINTDYDDLKYFNYGIHKYFKDSKCISGLKCSNTRLSYKKLKIEINNFNEKNLFIEVQDELINKIYKKLEEENINISKQ